MKLYSHPGSCSSAVHIILNEVGQNFELIKLDLFGDRILPDGRNFNDINPKGYVPVLELDNGELITEIAAILLYLGDLYPESGIVPANGDMQRTKLQEWLAFLNSEVHMTLGLFFKPELEGPMKDIASDKLSSRLQLLDDHLSKNDYLLGEQFSVADTYLYIILSWPAMLKMDISQYTNLIASQARIAERQSVKDYQAENS
jgi:glutathione S-transferase